MLKILDNVDSSKRGMNYSSSGLSLSIRNHMYNSNDNRKNYTSYTCPKYSIGSISLISIYRMVRTFT
jgi:hypothetical protein